MTVNAVHVHVTERYCLVFWPNENSYSDVPELKVVGEIGADSETIHVKEGTKVHAGVLIATRSKQEIQQKLDNIGDPCDEQGIIILAI